MLAALASFFNPFTGATVAKECADVQVPMHVHPQDSTVLAQQPYNRNGPLMTHELQVPEACT